MTKLVKGAPIWLFLPLVALLFLYGPAELSRVIYISVWQHAITSRAGLSPWNFILEMLTFWLFFILGLLLVYLRGKKPSGKDSH
jgi:hypothetical protein